MEQKFKQINNDEMGGVFLQCLNCLEVTEKDGEEKHKCPLTEREKSLVYLDEILKDESINVQDKCIAMRSYIEDMEKVEKREIEMIEKKTDMVMLRKIIYSVILEMVEKTRKYREKEYLMNDQRRAEGVSFEDRMKLINKSKIDWCDKQEKELLYASKNFKVKPLSEWLSVADIEMAKRRGEGMRFIIKFNLERVYTLPSKESKYEKR